MAEALPDAELPCRCPAPFSPPRAFAPRRPRSAWIGSSTLPRALPRPRRSRRICASSAGRSTSSRFRADCSRTSPGRSPATTRSSAACSPSAAGSLRRLGHRADALRGRPALSGRAARDGAALLRGGGQQRQDAPPLRRRCRRIPPAHRTPRGSAGARAPLAGDHSLAGAAGAPQPTTVPHRASTQRRERRGAQELLQRRCLPDSANTCAAASSRTARMPRCGDGDGVGNGWDARPGSVVRIGPRGERRRVSEGAVFAANCEGAATDLRNASTLSESLGCSTTGEA